MSVSQPSNCSLSLGIPSDPALRQAVGAMVRSRKDKSNRTNERNLSFGEFHAHNRGCFLIRKPPFSDLLKMAGVTGLEPATSGVTGGHSNQLSYTPA